MPILPKLIWAESEINPRFSVSNEAPPPPAPAVVLMLTLLGTGVRALTLSGGALVCLTLVCLHSPL